MLTSTNTALHRLGRPALVLAALLIVAACGDATGPEPPAEEGVDLALLFSPPTASESGAILSEWAGRDVQASDVVVLHETTLPQGSQGLTLRIISHRVGDVTHIGAIATPVGATDGSLPVIVYSHGGDQGENLDLTLLILPLALGDDIDNFVFVVPSFRSESLTFGGIEYPSSGDPSPWDRDVDDALSLLVAAFTITPEADPERIGVLGFSRGAAVGLLMAIRDPRIDSVVEFFGPTDFFGPFVQEVVEDALEGNLRDLPGLDFLNQEFIQPLNAGALSIAEMRLELLRRSPVYFAARLPDVQVHHGTADDVVPVGEAERLIEVMIELGRTAPGFESYLYEGGGHNPLSLAGALPRASEFLKRLLAARQEGAVSSTDTDTLLGF